MANFCEFCGTPLREGASFCMNCGRPVGVAPQPVAAPATTPPPTGGYTPPPAQPYGGYQQPYAAPKYDANGRSPQRDDYPFYPYINLLSDLSKRVKANGIIWIVIASLQYLAGLIFLVAALGNYGSSYGITNFFEALIVLAIAVLNTVGAVKDFRFSRDLFYYPAEILPRYEPIGGFIATLLYNLFLGGILGVAGSIYGLVVRGFVLSYKPAFVEIETVYWKEYKKERYGEEGQS